MGERARDGELVRVGARVSVGPVALLAIERVVVEADHGAAGAWLAATKAPLAVIIRDAGGVRAVGIDSAVTLQALRARVPGLDAALAEL